MNCTRFFARIATAAILGLLMGAPAAVHASLEVIGSGYARTGTDTLRDALNELGYKT